MADYKPTIPDEVPSSPPLEEPPPLDSPEPEPVKTPEDL